MKKYRSNSLLTALVVSVLCVISASCGNGNVSVNIEQVLKTYTVKGSISLQGSVAVPGKLVSSVKGSSAARAAVSAFSLAENESLEVVATYLDNASVPPVSGAPSLDSDSGNLSYELGLPLTGRWKLQAGIRRYLVIEEPQGEPEEPQPFEWVLYGSTPVDVTEDTIGTFRGDITIFPVWNENLPGSINLRFDDAAEEYDVSRVKCSFKNNASLNQDITFQQTDDGENFAELSLPSVPAGSYEVEFLFYSPKYDVLYQCDEILNVYSGFTTDTWLGNENSPYLVTHDGKTEFKLSDEVLSGFKYANPVSNPYLLWSFNSRPEIGYIALFEDDGLYDGVYVTSGIQLDDPILYSNFYNLKFDFAIDAKSNQFFLSISRKLFEYPKYSDYTKAQAMDFTLPGRFACYDGKLWSVGNDADGSLFYVEMVDTNLPVPSVDLYEILGIDEADFDITAGNPYKNCVPAVNDKYLFVGLVKENGPEIWLFQFAIDNDNRTLTKLAEYKLNAKTHLGTDDLAAGFTISDMQIMEGDNGTEIYVLIRDAEEQLEYWYYEYDYEHDEYIPNPSPNHMRGALLKFEAVNSGEENTITLSTVGGQSAYGWSEYYNPADKKYEAGEDPAACDSFLIPRRFIAVKPKKLVIADEAYVDRDEYDTRDYNRIVTIDLQTATQSIVVLGDDFELFGSYDSDFTDLEEDYR